MSKQIFVNLPIKNIGKTTAFFTGLGFEFNPQFSGEHAGCMIVNDNAFVMLLMEEFFKGFTTKAIADAHKTCEVMLAISTDSRQKVDEMVEAAIAAGGSESGEAKDHGFMYQRSFNDLDGHIWEVFWMDMSQFPGA